MSYSFTVRASNKADLIALATDELQKVVTAQPVHEVDQAQALDAVKSFVALVGEAEGFDYQLSVHGSVSSWDGVLRSAAVGVNVTLVS